MRYAVLVAALLTLAVARPNVALAFESSSSENTNADGSQRYVDPDENPQFGSSGADSDSGTGALSKAPGMQFGGGVSAGFNGSSQPSGWDDGAGWAGARTRPGH